MPGDDNPSLSREDEKKSGKSEKFSWKKKKKNESVDKQWDEGGKYVVLSLLWDPQVNASEYCLSLFNQSQERVVWIRSQYTFPVYSVV